MRNTFSKLIFCTIASSLLPWGAWTTSAWGQQDLIQRCFTRGEGLDEYQSNAVTLLMMEGLRQEAKATLQVCQQALELAKQQQNRWGMAAALKAMGNAFDIVGDEAKSIESLEEAFTLGRTLANFDVPSVVRILGYNYLQRGQYDRAIQLYQQRLTDIAQEKEPAVDEKALLLSDIGQAYFFLNNPNQAIQYYKQSLALLPESQFTKIPLAAALVKLGNWGEAQKVLESAIPKTQPITTSNALEFDWSRVLEFEWSGMRDLYSFLQKVLIAQDQPEKALEISEKGRAVAFTELLLYQSKLKSIDATLVHNPSVQQLQQIAAQQRATIVQYSLILDHTKFGFNPGVDSLYIWVIPPKGKVSFRQVNLPATHPPLEQLVASSLESIGVTRSGLVFREEVSNLQSNTPPLTQERLQTLYQVLIEPIEPLLPTDPEERVIFVPQQELFQVPFAALQDRSGKYLIEKHTISITPAIRVLALTRQQRRRIAEAPGGTILIAGNPAMPSVSLAPRQPPQQLAALPGAAEEAAAIAHLFGVQALIGKQATKAAIFKQIPNARIIHLATHGFMYAYSGDTLMAFSGPSGNYSMLLFPGILALAPAGKDNGLLPTGEIVALKLKAELVVLSACETGRGEVFSDGVLGLARSFLLAGTPSVVVSLWQVPDAPTAFLMRQFYQNLQQRTDKATALRRAMLLTLKEYPDPKAWAAFTLIGEAE